MIRSQLNSYSGSDPIWGFVALIASERYTGEAAVGIDPRLRLFAVDGCVYFAEREGDPPIGTRLVNSGAVSTAQLEGGLVQIGEKASLARLFQRQPAIDRDAVELTIALATESLLESVANKAVGMPEVFPLRHHSSGVHHWLRSAAPTPAAPPVVEEVVVEEAVVEAAVVEELPVVEVVPPPVVPEWGVELLASVTPAAVTTAVTIEALAADTPKQVPFAEPLLAPMSTLASLTMATLQSESAPDTDATPEPAQQGTAKEFVGSSTERPEFAPDNSNETNNLPKLPISPPTMADLTAAKGLATATFGESAHSLAAVDIWELVDVLVDESHEHENDLVGSGAPGKRNRTWLRGRKG